MVARKRGAYQEKAAPMRPDLLLRMVARRRDALAGAAGRLEDRAQRGLERQHAALDKWASRLAPALAGLLARSGRDIARDGDRLAGLAGRMELALTRRLQDGARRLEQLDRTRLTLGHMETLKRGFAIVRGDGQVVTSMAAAAAAGGLEIEFHDGVLALGAPRAATPVAEAPQKTAPAAKPKPSKPEGGSQGSLF